MVVFLFVTILVVLSTMTRLLDEERGQIACLLTLGYSPFRIIFKYLLFALIGTVIGGFGAYFAGLGLARIVYVNFTWNYTLPPFTSHISLAFFFITFAVILVATLAATAIAGAKLTRQEPADLLRPKTPKAGKKVFLERIPFIWNRLSFTHKVTARNLFRYKKRMFMTVFGVAGAVVLLIAGFGTQYSISGISAEQFGNIVTYDMIVADEPTATDAEHAELEDALGSSDVARRLPVHYEALTKVAGSNGDTQDITLIAPENPAELGDYIKLRERVSGEAVPLDRDSCVLSERLARMLGVGAGDTFTVNDAAGKEHTLTCTGVTEMYMGHFVFMGADAYAKAFGEDYAANASLVTLKDSSTDAVNAFATSLMELPAVAGIVQNTSLIAQIATIVGSLNKIMVVLIVVATLLAAVILYNLTTINVSERIRELSTIKVLGFFDREVTMYIYRETIILTVVGILVGYVFGVWFRNYIITVVPPDNVMFDPTFAPYVFWIPLVVVGAITALLGVVVNRRLRDVDMLEALKSVE